MTEQCRTVRTAVDYSWSIRTYADLKDRILACIQKASALEHTRGYPFSELREKIETNTFNLVVVGQFKRGKTCLINALLGSNILPVAVVPLTSIVTVLTYGEELRIRVFFNDGTVAEAGPERLADYVTETGNPKNIKDVKEVLIDYPSQYLRDGVRLIDTPGVGSVYQHNTDVAYQYLPKSDAALFLLSVEQPVSKAELDFLRDVQQYSHKIFFLLNKIDYLSEVEIRESIAFSQQTLREVMGPEVRIFPISAKLALNGQLECSEKLVEGSNLPAFSEVLNNFLLNEKGKVLLLSVTGNLQRILAQARFEAELEHKSLATPLEELREKIEAFKGKKEEILLEKENFEVLLNSEVSTLIRNGLDREVAAFKDGFTPQMERQLDSFYQENKDLPLNELNAALESYVAKEVEQAFSTWYAQEEEKLVAAFTTICDKFSLRIQEMVDELLEFSSQLFLIPFEPVRADLIWTTESGFYFKVREDAVGLDMLASSLTQVVPGLISSRFKKIKSYLFKLANKLIFSKRKEHMLEAIDMQAGRIRYAFTERLNKSKQSFRREMLQRIDATIEGIGSAIEKGMNRRAEGEKEAKERRNVLQDALLKLDELRDELLSIRESISSA